MPNPRLKVLLISLTAGLALPVGACKKNSLIKDDLDQSTLLGCYVSEIAPPILITTGEVHFNKTLLSADYKYGFYGRTSDKAIWINPRLYLRHDSAGFHFAPYQDLPPQYNALFATIPDGKQGQILEINHVDGQNPIYRRADASACE